jgi:prefoldin subunit 2
LLEEREGVAAMLLERQQDLDEHQLVMKTLRENDLSKKAWRLVGDVLVERTVGTVIPEVEKNKSNLEGLVENLKKQLESKTKELQEFESKYNIKIKQPGKGSGDSDRGKTPQNNNAGGQGVLVN